METEIRYNTLPSGHVQWNLVYEDGTRIHLFATSENGGENNKDKAKKAAEHAKRLTDNALARAAATT